MLFRSIAVDSLNALCHPDGIISTRPTLIRRARHRGLLTVPVSYTHLLRARKEQEKAAQVKMSFKFSTKA